MVENQTNTNLIPGTPPNSPRISQLPVILLLIMVILSLGGIGFLYWQNQQLQKQLLVFTASQKQPESSPASATTHQTPTHQTPTHPPIITSNPKWITESTNLIVEGERFGKATFILSFHYPDKWSLSKTSVPYTPGFAKNCQNYTLTNLQTNTVLTIKSICNGWSATYLPYPKDAKKINQREQYGNDGRTSYWFRVFNPTENSFQYAEADGTDPISTKVSYDLTIGSPAYDWWFVPVQIKLQIPQGKTISDTELQITDQIIQSLELQGDELNN